MTVKGIADEAVTTPSGIVNTRKYELLVHNPGGPFTMTVSVDQRARLARLDMPTANLSVVRGDLAGVSARTLTARNPTDSDVTIPANGFSIAATLTRPPILGRLRLPVVVLVAGSGPIDRDGTVAGIPVLSQLAGALARAGTSRAALRQARDRTERRPQRSRHAGRLRRRPHRHREVAGQARRCRSAPDCGRGAWRGRHDRDARGRAREEDRHARADGHRRDERRGPAARAAATRARSHAAARRREGAESGAAEADSGCRRQREGMGVAARGRAESRPIRRGFAAFSSPIPPR